MTIPSPSKKADLKAIAADIREQPEPKNLYFNHSLFCSVGLPRSKVEGPVYERRNGKALLRITASAPPLGNGLIPYGSRPRLILSHLTTEVVRTRKKEVEIGDSIRAFMLSLGLDTGGKGYSQMRQQAASLFSSHMVMGWLQGDHLTRKNMDIAAGFEAWLTDDGTQLSMWPGTLEVSQEFFESITEHAVPMDPRALKVLHQSPLQLDIYHFLAYRLCRISFKKPLSLSWDQIADQFGLERSSARQNFSVALKRVLTVYPNARVFSMRGGLQFFASPPPIKTIRSRAKSKGLI